MLDKIERIAVSVMIILVSIFICIAIHHVTTKGFDDDGCNCCEVQRD